MLCIGDNAEEFRLICKWDDTNELQATVVGEGARLENEYDVIETHTPDYILIQKIRVDPRTGKSQMALTSMLAT